MKSRNRLPQQIQIGVLPLTIAILLTAIIAGLLFKDYRQVPYGWFITIVWLASAFFTFGFGILFFAQFVLPPHKNESWLEGVAILLRAINRPATSRSRSSGKGKTPQFPGEEYLPESFNTLKAGILKNNQVISIGKGSYLERAAGPGFIRLRAGERITQVVDLRTHIRSQEVVINTRDGIPLETEIKVGFRIKKPEHESSNQELQYPYEQRDIFLVSQASSINASDRLIVWTEQIAPQAATYLVSEAAHHSLDELLLHGPGPGAFTGVQRRIQGQLEEDFSKSGIEIMSVRVTPRELPAEVTQQRIENWRVHWQNLIQAQIATSDAETTSRINQARANAQAQSVRNIIRNIEDMRQTEGADLSQVVTLCMIEVLEKTMPDNLLRSTISGQILSTMALEASSQMRALITHHDEVVPHDE